MKKAKVKPSRFDVDGPFLQAKERLLDFGESLTFSGMIQVTVEKIEECEEEYKLAVYMDDFALAREKKKNIRALTKSLVFAAKLMEEESGISA